MRTLTRFDLSCALILRSRSLTPYFFPDKVLLPGARALFYTITLRNSIYLLVKSSPKDLENGVVC